MEVKLAETEEQIRRCFPIMLQLRPDLTEDEFVTRVRRQNRHAGYRLAYAAERNEIKAVAGFRIMEMLSRGRFLYVDDLVTNADDRAKGYGTALFNWLVEYARSEGCERLELDSGVQRIDAHRFYFGKQMYISSFHFSLPLGPART